MNKVVGIVSALVALVLIGGVYIVVQNNNSDLGEDAILEKSSEATALFDFVESEYDFGVIKQSGGKVLHDFSFTYTGTEPIKITGVPTSCACTSATVDKTTLNPGDTGVITVKFNPNLHEEPDGKFFKTISLLTEPQIEDMPEVRMWAEIDLDLGPEAYELTFDHVDEEGEEESGLTSYTSITSEKLAIMLKDKDFTMIDVHIPEQKHIEGTDAFIPYNDIEHSSKLPKDKNAKIVLYCRSGGMSRAAAYTLAEEGYTNVYDLAGGKNAYDAYMAENKIQKVSKASIKAGSIEFDAEVITSQRIPALKQELGKEFDALALDMGETNILLIGNNHRIDISGFEYSTMSTLDGQNAIQWQPLSDAVGGHHIAGVLAFAYTGNPEKLVITGLPTEDAVLSFENIL